MKKPTLFYLFMALNVISITSCTQSTFDDIVADDEPIPEVVTYLDIKSIIDNNCISCHSNPPQNGAPMPLVTYNNVKEAVLDRGLLDRINRGAEEEGLMPLGGPPLSQPQRELFSKWEEDGLLEN